MAPRRVAVYGTLLPGCRNAGLMAGARRVGAGVAPGFALFAHCGPRCPAAAQLGAPHAARVEVFDLPDRAAAEALDRLECYPGWYDRALVPVELEGEGEGAGPVAVEAWIYFMSPEDAGRGGTAELIASGSWKQYLDSLGIAWDAPLDPSPPASQVPPALPT